MVNFYPLSLRMSAQAREMEPIKHMLIVWNVMQPAFQGKSHRRAFVRFVSGQLITGPVQDASDATSKVVRDAPLLDYVILVGKVNH